MSARGALVAIAAAQLAAAGALAACGLDFDRYDPKDASADVAAEVQGIDSNASDGGGSADVTPCMAPPDCFEEAGACALDCDQQYQKCVSNCTFPGCRQGCAAGGQTCAGKCATACISCAQNAGCPASADCLDASQFSQ